MQDYLIMACVLNRHKPRVKLQPLKGPHSFSQLPDIMLSFHKMWQHAHCLPTTDEVLLDPVRTFFCENRTLVSSKNICTASQLENNNKYFMPSVSGMAAADSSRLTECRFLIRSQYRNYTFRKRANCCSLSMPSVVYTRNSEQKQKNKYMIDWERLHDWSSDWHHSTFSLSNKRGQFPALWCDSHFEA